MGRSSKTTEFLKECMADALIRLMHEDEYEKISVRRIVEVAGVARATFYRNFEEKSDLLKYKLICLWNRWATENGLNDENYSVACAPEFFSFCYNERELFNLILDAGHQSIIYEAFYTIMKSHFEKTAIGAYRSRFLSYALFGLLDEWLKRGYKETPKEMSEIYRSILNSDLKMI